MSLADVKAVSRQALHEFMSRPAVFYDHSGSLVGNVTARFHDESKMVGDLAGTNLSYAEHIERPTTLVLWKSELLATVKRGAEFIFTTDEGWLVDTVEPADNQTITVRVSPMSATDLAGKQLPDGTLVPV